MLWIISLYLLLVINNGLLLQFGTGFSNTTTNFPLAITDKCIIITTSYSDKDDSNTTNGNVDWYTKTQFYLRYGWSTSYYNVYFYWISIGY